jgi:Holliday junction resolvasome RuvABC endonuclease subunit
MTIIAGFDVSSHTVGFSVIDTSFTPPKVVICSYFSPPKKGTYVERIKETQDKITEICQEYKPDEIAIEEILQYVRGKSGAKTIIALARFNCAVALAAYAYTGVSPTFYSVLKIRHAVKLTKKFPDKLEIPSIMTKRLKFKFPTVYMKKKPTKVAVETYDAADSLAVALTHYLETLPKTKLKK